VLLSSVSLQILPRRLRPEVSERRQKLKLRRTGLLDPSVPFASSDDALSREQIMRIAAGRPAKKYMVEFSGVTFIGDGVWDVSAAQSLGWTFIGIGTDENAACLRRAGADMIIPDYNPIARFSVHSSSVAGARRFTIFASTSTSQTSVHVVDCGANG
jgi:hypothetical protein